MGLLRFGTSGGGEYGGDGSEFEITDLEVWFDLSSVLFSWS